MLLSWWSSLRTDRALLFGHHRAEKGVIILEWMNVCIAMELRDVVEVDTRAPSFGRCNNGGGNES